MPQTPGVRVPLSAAVLALLLGGCAAAQYGRNAYDPAALNEAQTRLQTFQGATSISSNQYFGREEDETAQHQDAVLGDGTLANLEGAAKEVISRVLANPEVQNAADSIRAGALKVSTCMLSA